MFPRILRRKNDQHETPRNDAPKRNKNVHVCPPRRRPCFNFGENNHSQNQTQLALLRRFPSTNVVGNYNVLYDDIDSGFI
jgi:hypothetical protein